MKMSLRQNAKQAKNKELLSFLEELLTEDAMEQICGSLYQNGDYFALLPAGFLLPKGIRVIRFGLPLGELKKNRFEPHHSLAISLRKEECKKAVDVSLEEALRFLKGETLQTEADVKGYAVLCCHNMTMGFGKVSGQIIKNHYPKGLRILV